MRSSLVLKQQLKPVASLSLDLDNKWSYMKTHGDSGWDTYPSYLDVVVPRVLAFLKERDLTGKEQSVKSEVPR